MPELLSKEPAFFKNNLQDLADEYPGRYLLIKGEDVVGAFETHDLGVDAGIKLFGRGPFLVRSVTEPDPEPLTIPAMEVGVPFVADSYCETGRGPGHNSPTHAHLR